MDINFDCMKFCAKAKILSIIYYQIFMKAHRLIGKVENYYAFIRQIYDIIQIEKKV